MTSSKKSFVVYMDIEEITDDLTDEQVGQLFRGMIAYQKTGKEPKFKGVLKYIFIPIRQQMDRDSEKWESTREKRAVAGRQGGIRSGQVRKAKSAKIEANEANEANALNKNVEISTDSAIADSETEANEAVNVNVTVTDTVNANVNVTDNVTTTDNVTVPVGSVVVSDDDDDSFDIWKRMTPNDVDAIYDVYPESGGNLIEAVYHEVKTKRRKVRDPVPYILAYAKNVEWDDIAEGGAGYEN